MLAVLASAADEDARSLLPHFRRFEPLLLTPSDIWQSGWRLRTDTPQGNTAIVSDRRVDVADIEGVITLLPVVLPQELVVIAPDSREYVAQEMTAFLRYFLMSLRRPVLNRATAGSLCGPFMRTEAWLQMAASCGIPTDPWVRRSAEADESSSEPPLTEFCVTVIGDAIVEDEHAMWQSKVRALARAASAGMLAVRFRETADGRSVLSGVDACPRLIGPRAAWLLEQFFANSVVPA